MSYMLVTDSSADAILVKFVKGQGESLKRTSNEYLDVDVAKTIVDYIPELRNIAGKAGKVEKHPRYVSENMLSVVLGGLQRAYDRKANKNCLSKYLSIIRELHADIYDFGFVITLPLDKLELLHYLNAHISQDHKLGEITEEYAEKAKNALLGFFTEDTQQMASKQVDTPLPTALWPQDKAQGEKAVDFLRRIWGDSIKNNSISRHELRKLNLSLYRAVTVYFTRNDILDKNLELWWNKSPQQKPEVVQKTLDTLGIKKPKDAFERGLDPHEALRLYNAAKRRI